MPALAARAKARAYVSGPFPRYFLGRLPWRQPGFKPSRRGHMSKSSRIRRPALLGALVFAVTVAMLGACVGLMDLAHTRTAAAESSLASSR